MLSFQNSLTRLTDFNEFGTKRYKWESLWQFLLPYIYNSGNLSVNVITNLKTTEIDLSRVKFKGYCNFTSKNKDVMKNITQRTKLAYFLRKEGMYLISSP